MRASLILRSILFALLFYVATGVTMLVTAPIAVVSGRSLVGVARRWGHSHSLLARLILGIRLEVEGVVPATPMLVAAKHESAYETLALLWLLGDPVIVLKRELAAVPLFGWLIRRHGVIPVDRSASAPALRLMLRAADLARTLGRAVLIFPEGTRVRHGDAPKLAAGFAGLYGRLAMPVVPVATDAGLAWPRGLMKRTGTIRLRFGEPIPAGLPRAEIEARVHAAINALNA